MEKNNTEHLFDKDYGPSGYRDNTPEEEIYVTDREEEAYWLNLFRSEIEATGPVQIPPAFPPLINPLLQDYPKMEPKFLADREGNFMLYPGETHFIYGMPGTYKTFLLLKLIGTCNVVYIDFENHGPTMKSRLNAMKVDPKDAQVFDFPETKVQVIERVKMCIENKPDVVCFDGLPGLARMFSIDPDSNDQVSSLFAQVIDQLKKAGIAVVLLDHITKEGNRDDYPIGAQTKKSQSGVMYLLRPRKETSVIDLFVTKDRHNTIYGRCEDTGQVRHYGWLEINNDPTNGLLIDIAVDQVADIDGQTYERNEAFLYGNVHSFIGENFDCSQTLIEGEVRGKTASIRNALHFLESKKYIQIVEEKGRKKHRVLKPFDPEWRARNSSSLNDWR